MTVFIHIGSHKTGTTAIQTFSSFNASWLRDHKLIYPSFDLVGGKRARSHLGLIKMLLASPEDAEHRKALAVLHAARDSGREAGADLLFSAESLFRLAPKQLERITKTFNEVFREEQMAVVCALRSQLEFADSLYRNTYRSYVKLPKSFREWYAGSRGLLDYASIITEYAMRLEAKLVLLPYHRGNRLTFVSDFFSSLGHDVSGAPSSSSERNPSLDVVDCLAKQIVMGGTTDQELSKAFNTFSGRNPQKTDYGFLGPDVEREIMSACRQGNGVLMEKEPALAPALGASVTSMRAREIDAECLDLARSRAQAFSESQVEV